MRELRGLPPSDDRINVRRAHHLVKKCAANYYFKKTWKVQTFSLLEIKSSEQKNSGNTAVLMTSFSLYKK